MYDQIIRSSFDVVSTSGDEFLCRCPWHQDGQKPNLYVNGRKGVYLCHSCGQKGHLRHLGERLPTIHTQDIRDKMAEMNKPTAIPKVFAEGWLKKYDFPHPAWDERLSKEIQETFRLGFDPFEEVLTIPLRDSRNRLMGVITRRLDDQKPKYRYPKGFKIGKHLFASWMIKHRHQKVAIVEGSVDAMACWDARVPALALLGSRMTEDQRDLLMRLNINHVVLMLDNDKAGWDGRQQVYDRLHGTGVKVSVGVYRPYWMDKDPAALKPDRRRKMFHSAKDWHEWKAVDNQGYIG